MKLTRDKIQRMMGNRGGSTTSSTGSGSSGGISGNGVTPEYYNQNFELLYKQTVTSGGTTTTTYLTALPNEVVAVGTVTDETTGDVTVTSLVGPVAKNALVIGNLMLVYDSQNNAIKVVSRDGVSSGNFYATGSVSALGYAAGGGGGGASALTDLVDVAISSPTNGQVLMYNSTTGKWYNGTVQQGSSALVNLTDVTISSPTNGQVLMYNSTTGKWYNGTVQQGSSAWSDITGKPTTIAGYGITDAKIQNGTITLGSNTITPLTSYTETDPTVPAWAKAASKPSYSFSELTSHPTTIAGYGITDAKIQNGTITLGSNSITPLTSEQYTGTVTSVGASDGLVTNQTAGAAITSSGVISINSETRQAISHGETAYGWGNHANKYLLLTGGTLTGTTTFNNACWTIAANENNEISSKHWGNSSLYNNANTAVLSSLAAIRNALRFRWYNTYWNIGNIRNSGDGTYGFGIALEDTTNDRLIDCFHVDSSGTINSLLYFDTTNNRIGVKASSPKQELDVNGSAIVTNLFIRSGLRLYEGSTYIWEICYEAGSNNGCFNFYRYNSNTYAGNTWMAINPSNGNVGLGGTTNPQATIDIPSGGKIKIGGGVLKWDSTNNALYVEKSDGTSASFYATGSVSALGFSAGTSAIDAMTFNHLSVKNSMTLNGSVNIITGSSSQIVRSSSDSDCIYLLNYSGSSKVTSYNYYYNQYDNVGLHGSNYNYDETWFIDPDGCALFQRVYLSNNVYLYTDGSNIKVRIGSTVYTLTKS